MEDSEISLQEVLVYRALCQNQGRWFSDRQLAQQIEGVTARSIRTHCLKLVKHGLVDQPNVFPADRYRLSAEATRPDHPYVRRLEHAATGFGLAKQTSAQFR
jgi:hypothetical protein